MGGVRVLWGMRCGKARSALAAHQGRQMCFRREGFTQDQVGQDGQRVVQLQNPVLRPFCTALLIHSSTSIDKSAVRSYNLEAGLAPKHLARRNRKNTVLNNIKVLHQIEKSPGINSEKDSTANPLLLGLIAHHHSNFIERCLTKDYNQR